MTPRRALLILSLIAHPTVVAQAQRPRCVAEPGRRAERVMGRVGRDSAFSATTRSGWILRLEPGSDGWMVRVGTRSRPSDDLSRLTQPWHFVPNPRQLAGWHFRNKSNTGPNDGSVNAPGTFREFIFSPEVGQGIEYEGSATSDAAVDRVAAFGRGWLHIDAYRLTPLRRGEKAAFEWLRFTACLTWPADAERG